MGLSQLLALITPETAMGFAIGAVIVAFGFWRELIVSGSRHKATLKKLARSERRERIWQRLCTVNQIAAVKAGGMPELGFEMFEMEDCE